MDYENAALPVEEPEKPKKSLYAWVVTSSGFLSQVAANFTVAGWGMCLAYMAHSFGVETTTLAIGTSIFGVIYAALAVFWGNLSDRVGLRKVMTIGALGTGIMLVCIGFLATNAIMAIVMYACAGVFLSAISFSLLPKLVSTWFATHSRGLGFGLTAAGGSIGGVILGVIAPMMINFGGWQAYFKIIGGIVILIGVIILVFVRNSPASIGALPWGAEKETEAIVDQKKVDKHASSESNFQRIKRIVKLKNTWIMAIVFILFQIHYMAHQALFITALLSAGYDITVAGAISSITYVGITVGQIAFPIVSDRCARKNVLGSLMVLSGLSYMALSLLLRTSISIEAVFVLVAVTGAMLAANANMQATMTELFPPDLRGAGPGFINTLGMIGKFAGPVLAGAMVAATGGDMLNYMFVGGPAALAAGIIALVFLPKTSGKYGDPVAVEYAKKMEEKEKANATSLSYDNETTA